MYNIVFLPLAKKDIYNTLYYIAKYLNNPSAARVLSNKIISNINNILTFPYGAPIYKTNQKLQKEYRSVRINNYLLLYTISEKDKTITVSRFLYQKMNISLMI